MLGTLIDAVDELCDTDVASLSDDELHRAVVEMHTIRTARLVAVQSRLLAEWDARRTWADDGSRSAGARLARETGSNPKACNFDVGRARSLRTMPHTMAALSTGAISGDKAGATEVVRVRVSARRSRKPGLGTGPMW